MTISAPLRPARLCTLGCVLLIFWWLDLTEAQEAFAPPSNVTLQRMCVGVIQGDAVIGWSRSRETNTKTAREYDVCNWYQGKLASGRIMPLLVSKEDQPEPTQNRTNTLIRRWYWRDGRLWFAIEAMYGPRGLGIAKLYRTKPISESDPVSPIGRNLYDATWDGERRELTEIVPIVTQVLSEEEAFEEISLIEPLRRPVQPLSINHSIQGVGEFRHRDDGFDLIPHSLDHWTLFMTVQHTMQIWQCRSERLMSGETEKARNTWKLDREFWVPWRGQFFVFEVKEPSFHFREYVVVRDCGEVHLVRVERGATPDRDMNTSQEDRHWNGRQLLHPTNYLIAILYIEPENAVYGFGPNFYVRLDAPLQSIGKKTPCGYVTEGKAIWADEEGESHELGEPFRTVWQCAQVLKEDGVIDDPDGVEAATEQ